MQGKDRTIVKYVAQQLGMEGSYISRTYIEQIQLEKIVDEVMVWQFLSVKVLSLINALCLTFLQALPDDLKTKLGLDEDMVSSPKEALSKALVDQIPPRRTHMRWNFLSFFIFWDQNIIDAGLKNVFMLSL